MIRAVIIDDEKAAIERLTELLLQYSNGDISLVGSAQGVEEGIDCLLKTQPDLVFLDIEIGYESGFDLLRGFRHPTFSVVFTTAYEQYALQAIKFSALDYLLKPIDPDDLLRAIAKKKATLHLPSLLLDFDVLLNNFKLLKQGISKIMVPTLQGFELLNTTEIIRCQSDINYTTIYLVNKRQILVAKTIKEFENLLTQHQFYRIHQSHLVNLNYIKSYHKGKGGSVILQDGVELPVATRRKDDFLWKIQSIS